MSVVLAYFLSWLSITGGIYGLFNMTSEVLHETKKKELSKWLLSKQSAVPSSNWPDRLPSFQEFTMLSLQGLGFKGSIGIFVHTAFFTSVWVWLYVLSGFTIKLIAPLLTRLKIKDKPLQSMGWLLVALITLGYLIAVVVTLIGN